MTLAQTIEFNVPQRILGQAALAGEHSLTKEQLDLCVQHAGSKAVFLKADENGVLYTVIEFEFPNGMYIVAKIS